MPFQLDTARCTTAQPSYGAVPGVDGTGHVRLLCPPHMVAAAIFWGPSGAHVTCCLLYWPLTCWISCSSAGSPVRRGPSTASPGNPQLLLHLASHQLLPLLTNLKKMGRKLASMTSVIRQRTWLWTPHFLTNMDFEPLLVLLSRNHTYKNVMSVIIYTKIN